MEPRSRANSSLGDCYVTEVRTLGCSDRAQSALKWPRPAVPAKPGGTVAQGGTSGTGSGAESFVILAERALEQTLHCILGKIREDMTPDEGNRPDQPNSVRLAVMTAWHSGERQMMAREMRARRRRLSALDGPRAAVPRLPSVVEFCGNELTICRNTFGLVRPSI
jgi:hypothetical protein